MMTTLAACFAFTKKSVIKELIISLVLPSKTAKPILSELKTNLEEPFGHQGKISCRQLCQGFMFGLKGDLKNLWTTTHRNISVLPEKLKKPDKPPAKNLFVA